jgi:UDPglucose 6-dehydrogenase
MSWLAQDLRLSHDIFTDIMKTREDQTAWLVDLIIEWHRRSSLPIVLMGMSFKAGTKIMTGSAAVLLGRMLSERGYNWSSVETIEDSRPNLKPKLFFISCRHEWWSDVVFPHGSVIMDPWRYMGDRSIYKCVYVPIGHNNDIT